MKKLQEKRKKLGNKGFSMIELIIVIAIMAILVGIIGSQIIPYMEKSRQSKDKSVLDAVYTAFSSAITESEMSAAKTLDLSDLDGSDDFELAFQGFLGENLKTKAQINAKFGSKMYKDARIVCSYNFATETIQVVLTPVDAAEYGTVTVDNLGSR